MEELKSTRLSMLTLCFGLMVFIFFLQITVIGDKIIWNVKLRTKLSICRWVPDRNVNGSAAAITCDYSNKEYDLCTINGSTLLDPTSSTIYAVDLHTRNKSRPPLKFRPYPRKSDKVAMSFVKELNLIVAQPKLSCNVTHHTPALVFSAAGYTGNHYHEINEIFIPLFITINKLFSNQDVTLVVTEGKMWWFQKYAELLAAFSPHRSIINANNLSTVHCFPSATLGLMKHGPMIIDPKLLLPNPKTLIDFRAFLGKVYSKLGTPFMYPKRDKPQLTLISRTASRVITNEEDVIKVAEELGFIVHVFEASRSTPMRKVYGVVHGSDVLLGVHGAGLTNFLFMRKGSVLVQVVPIGLEWVSTTYYEKPPKYLGVEYLEYKIEVNESSLLQKYGGDSLVVKNPGAFQTKWPQKRLHWTHQNVTIDITRFRNCLIKAHEKAKIFITKVN
ncbi:protein O-linked-mannose beta-1,4-N-acetylglucosaminyltransferase 2 [Vigna radiata var. radiata]|uniref:Protein O-linked-mannose beta-1,4-N-acetylglucosaminyltransferase 2 n=1 Tax=Vigna radiata var. radiata TaxID=3916 RepID=A0A1S3TGK3_VIGRR|nr:protein O-linked-mannose beta-1,4-N-acetylglucosaminyltransferase 2 [Vigna radiata var. radiata]